MAYNKKYAELGESVIDYVNDLEDRVSDSVIIDRNYSTSNGYVRWGNGFQIAWKVESFIFNGEQFGSVYYADHTFGNWEKPFTTIFNLDHTCNSQQYWTTSATDSVANGGRVRLFRPNSATGERVEVTALAIGRWK